MRPYAIWYTISLMATPQGVQGRESADRPAIPEVPLRTSVRDRIRREIVAGTLAPGTRLVERNLAADLGVSRVPVREALRDLVAEGYAVDRATRGIAVRDYPAAEIDELFEIRDALEGVLLHRALAGLAECDEAKLRRCLDDARSALEAGDLLTAVGANAKFHEVLAEVAAGPMLRQMLLGVRDRMRWLLRQHGNPEQIHAEHEALLDAICAGDRPEAERLFRQHLSTSRAAVGDQAVADRASADRASANRMSADRASGAER